MKGQSRRWIPRLTYICYMLILASRSTRSTRSERYREVPYRSLSPDAEYTLCFDIVADDSRYLCFHLQIGC
ncbi:hypothetical protein GGI35DRAFT_464944 [Trichoderma velutinum]